jgi:hypothetical protein
LIIGVDAIPYGLYNTKWRDKAMKLTDKIRNQAEKVVELTMAEARKLPGFLGKFVPAHFEYHGFYAAVVDGKKTLYLPKKELA